MKIELIRLVPYFVSNYYRLRIKRSLYSSITDADLLSKQLALMYKTGGVDVLGQIVQDKWGHVDTRDFGQNVHKGYQIRIPPGEKERAENEQRCMVMAHLLRTYVMKEINSEGKVLDVVIWCKIRKYGSSVVISGQKMFSNKMWTVEMPIM